MKDQQHSIGLGGFTLGNGTALFADSGQTVIDTDRPVAPMSQRSPA